ncbi:MAG: plasmid pRiA4b ORF-3 family protein [Actinomycetota bacterium]
MQAMTFDVKVTLSEIEPPIWRRLRVSETLTLDRLHIVLQIAMGWTDSHLHQFLIDDRRYALPSPEDGIDRPGDERKVRLSDVVKVDSCFTYEYDFGDGWQHEVEVESVYDGTPAVPAECLDGRRACPPEDCGGPWGYVELLEILADPSHEEHGERREWVGDDFDPEAFDLPGVNDELRRFGSRLGPKRRR